MTKNKLLPGALILAVIAASFFPLIAYAVDYGAGVIFLSEVGGGDITFSADISADTVTWVGNQIRFTNLTFNAFNWGDIGFRAPNTSNTMTITLINATHITIDTTQASNTTYEVYLDTVLGPTVTGAVSSNYVTPTVSYLMTGAGTVTLGWDAPPAINPKVHVLMDSYTEAFTTSRDIKTVHPSPNATISAVGQSFNSSMDARLTSVKFYLSELGTPTGNLTAILYSHSGSFGINGTPTGAALATSDPIIGTTLPDFATYGFVSFNFSGANMYPLVSEQNYFIVIEGTSGPLNGADYVRVGTSNTGPVHDGNQAYYANGWSDTGNDVMFYMYVEGLAPENLDAETDGFITQNKGEWLNVTVRDYNSWENLDNVTIKVDTNEDVNTFSLQWIQATDVFSETIDADNICLLNASRSIRVTLNTSAINLCFLINMTGGEQGLGNVTVTSYDEEGLSDVDEYVGVFGFTVFNISDALWDLVNSVFASFGVIDWLGQATTFISAIVAHFADSLIGLATMINLQFQVIWAVFGWFTGWATRMITTILAIGTAMSNIMNGATGGFTNLWTSFNFSSWIDIVPIFLIVWWVQTVTRRAKTQGLFTVLNGDFNAFANIFAFFMGAFAAIIGYVEGKISVVSNYLNI